MDKLELAKDLLIKVGMPVAQHGAIGCLSLLAMADLKEHTPWKNAKNEWIRIHDILIFAKEHYHNIYAENSRETFRKQAMHPFRTASLIEDNGEATNSPNYRYRITCEFLSVIQHVNENGMGNTKLTDFLLTHETLSSIYASKKKMQKMPVKINGRNFTFSKGKHNQLQKAVLEEFAPRFAPGSECLYVGDTIQKDMVKNTAQLKKLGFEITLHDKMPDVVLYRVDKDWIYFIECVTSVGPMDAKRIIEIKDITRNVKLGKIYVTAFLDFKTYKRFSESLAWETEVWLSEIPDHMIHLNGDKFIGPQ